MPIHTLNRRISIAAPDDYTLGLELGRALGADFRPYVEYYLERRLAGANQSTLPEADESLAWINALPANFAARFRGLADGSDLPFALIAQWGHLEEFLSSGCSSVVCKMPDGIWLAHNNDTFVPEAWGYITVSHLHGRIPTATFGLAGDLWATAGINKEGLGLTTDFLPATDGHDSIS